MTDQTKKPETKAATQTKKPEIKTSGSFVVALGVVKHSGKDYVAGEPIPVSGADAKRLIDLGVIKEKP